MNAGDLNKNEAVTFVYWTSIIDNIEKTDCPIDEKIENLNEMFDGLKEGKEGAGKAFPLILRKIITTRVGLIKEQQKRNEEEEKKKKNAAALKIQGMYKTKKAKKKRCNLKIRKILDEHLRDKVSKPLKKIEELALKKSPSTEFKIRTEPQGSLLKPDGTFEVPKDKLYAWSKEQQKIWDEVNKDASKAPPSKAPPGFLFVKPTGKPPHDKDGKPIGGRRKKTKRRRTRKRRTKSRRKRRTKRRRKRKTRRTRKRRIKRL